MGGARVAGGRPFMPQRPCGKGTARIALARRGRVAASDVVNARRAEGRRPFIATLRAVRTHEKCSLLHVRMFTFRCPNLFTFTRPLTFWQRLTFIIRFLFVVRACSSLPARLRETTTFG